MHLRFNTGCGSPAPYEHPQVVMKQLGIAYQHATPQPIGDQWWFWNCENVPDPLPPYLKVLPFTPHECVGFGLSEAMANEITQKE